MEWNMGMIPSGLKDALEYVVDVAAEDVETFDIDGKTYCTHELHCIGDAYKPILYAKPLQVSTLTGLIDYVKGNRDEIALDKAVLLIDEPTVVSLVSSLDVGMKRQSYIDAAPDLPDQAFGAWREIEQFMIWLQTSFAPTDDRETLLKYVGNIKEDETIRTTDDGVSQKIVAHTGVATVDTVILPNPVKLRPYRTFQELEQPESEFILRLRKGGEIALFEADGGAWRIAARAAIKQYLVDALADVPDICVIG